MLDQSVISQSTNLPISQFSEVSLPLRLIRVRADDVLGNRDTVRGAAVGAERRVGVLIALLFVRRTVTLDRTFAFILVSLFRQRWLNTHRKLLYNLPILWNEHSPSS